MNKDEILREYWENETLLNSVHPELIKSPYDFSKTEVERVKSLLWKKKSLLKELKRYERHLRLVVNNE